MVLQVGNSVENRASFANPLTLDVLQPKFPHSIEYSTALIRDNVLQPMIDRYSKTLRQVILLDIWQNHSCDSSLIPVNVDWNQSFSITDLVCGTRPRRRPGQVLPSSQSEYITPWYQRTLDDCFLYKHLLEVHEVHPFLIRLRIDQVHFLDDLVSTIFEGLEFPKLRVLMLYP